MNRKSIIANYTRTLRRHTLPISSDSTHNAVYECKPTRSALARPQRRVMVQQGSSGLQKRSPKNSGPQVFVNIASNNRLPGGFGVTIGAPDSAPAAVPDPQSTHDASVSSPAFQSNPRVPYDVSQMAKSPAYPTSVTQDGLTISRDTGGNTPNMSPLHISTVNQGYYCTGMDVAVLLHLSKTAEAGGPHGFCTCNVPHKHNLDGEVILRKLPAHPIQSWNVPTLLQYDEHLAVDAMRLQMLQTGSTTPSVAPTSAVKESDPTGEFTTISPPQNTAEFSPAPTHPGISNVQRVQIHKALETMCTILHPESTQAFQHSSPTLSTMNVTKSKLARNSFSPQHDGFDMTPAMDSQLRNEQTLSTQTLGQPATMGCLYILPAVLLAMMVGECFYPICGLLDSGSNVTLIGSNHAQSMGGQTIYSDPSETTSSCGTKERVHGSTTITLLVGPNSAPLDATKLKRIAIPAYVTPSPVHQDRLLLGSNVIRALGMSLHEDPVLGTATLSYSVAHPGPFSDSPPTWQSHSFELEREGGECNQL